MLKQIGEWAVLLPLWRKAIPDSRGGQVGMAIATPFLYLIAVVIIASAAGVSSKSSSSTSNVLSPSVTGSPSATASASPTRSAIASPSHQATSTTPQTTAQPTLAPTTADTPAPTTADTPGPTAAKLMGALVTDWDGAHQVDAAVNDGSAYLPTLPDGRDTWEQVQKDQGRVIGFRFNVGDPGEPAAAAELYASEWILPADAHQVYSMTLDGTSGLGCRIEQFQSLTLGSLFAIPQIGDRQGLVDLVLFAALNPSPSFDADHVDTIVVTLGSPGDNQGAAC